MIKKLFLFFVSFCMAGFFYAWFQSKQEGVALNAWLLTQGQSFATQHADKLPLKQIGSYIFDKHCASCHDNPLTKAPTRDALAQMSKDSIMVAMEFGKMQAMAAHLNKQQRGLIALYLTGDQNQDAYTWIDQHRCQKSSDKLLSEESALVDNWGLGLANLRFVADELAGINKHSVKQLELSWTFVFPNVADVRSQPVVTEDSLIIGDKSGLLYALDRRTGCVEKHIKVISGIRSAINRVELSDGRVLLVFADSLATVYAVDADSFDIVWQQAVPIFETSVVTGSIAYYQDRLYVPLSSYEVAVAGMGSYPCCKSHGAVVALDANNGKRIWTWHATEQAVSQEKNTAGIAQFGPSGAVVWTTPTVDTKRRRLYFGTGENLSLPATDTSDAVIALDMDSGKLVWKFQALANDVWNSACHNGGPNCPKNPGPDFDFGASVILAELDNGKQLLIAGQKSGEVFALDPDVEGPVGKVVWQRRVSQGSTNGGIHWGMALSGSTLLVPIADPERDIPGYIPKPGLYALNLLSGELLWQFDVQRGCDFDAQHTPKVGLEHMRSSRSDDSFNQYKCSYYYGLSAAATATSELVFSAGLDGKVRAFSVDNGELLWKYNTAQATSGVNGVPGHGGAIDVTGQVVADGWLYVLSGYSMFGQLPGNVLYAFKVANAAPDTGLGSDPDVF